MNPLKALLGPLERLITEHGSAVVQGKHIALLKDQIVILERENAILRQKVIDLAAEKVILKTDNQNLKIHNAELTVKIDNLKKLSPDHDDLLSEHDFDPFNY